MAAQVASLRARPRDGETTRDTIPAAVREPKEIRR